MQKARVTQKLHLIALLVISLWKLFIVESTPWICRPDKKDLMNQVCLTKEDQELLRNFPPHMKRFVIEYWFQVHPEENVSRVSNNYHKLNRISETRERSIKTFPVSSLSAFLNTTQSARPGWINHSQEDLTFENFPEALNSSQWLRSRLQRTLLWKKLYTLSQKVGSTPRTKSVIALPVVLAQPGWDIRSPRRQSEKYRRFNERINDVVVRFNGTYTTIDLDSEDERADTTLRKILGNK